MSTKDKLKAAEIFLNAALYIRNYGWQETGMSSHGKPRCSMGALASAHQTEEWDPEIADLMYKTLYDQLDGINLTEFNARAQSGEDVATLFEQTAKIIKGVN
jgi:hypothetical protein